MRNGQAENHQDRSTWTLVRLQEGGFRLEGDAEVLEALPSAEGLIVHGGGERNGWLLRKESRCSSGGYVLLRSVGQGAGEIARTTRFGDETVSRSCLMTADGRLFRIVVAGPRDGRYELLGWEVPGAYLDARPMGEQWKIRKTPAGHALSGSSGIVLLFAAEILEAEGPSGEL